MTDDAAFDRLIEIASRLIGLMLREVDMLRTMRPQDIAPLQHEKAALTQAFEERIRALAPPHDGFAALAPALRRELASVVIAFNTALMENERALAAARGAHERVLRLIVDAVAESQASHTAYSMTGRSALPLHPPGVSLSLDRRL